MNLNPRWSYVIQRHGSCETTFLQKMKKSCSKSDQKEGPVCVKYQRLMLPRRITFWNLPRTTFQSLSRQTHVSTVLLPTGKNHSKIKRTNERTNERTHGHDLNCAHRLLRALRAIIYLSIERIIICEISDLSWVKSKQAFGLDNVK